MSVSTASTRRYSRTRGRVPPALAAGLALVAALAGTLGGGAFRSEPAPVAKPSPQVLASGGLRMQAPEGWARSAPATLAGFSHALWLRDEAAKLDAAVEMAPAVSPTLLPAGLRPVGAPSVQQLGRHAAWRYRIETSTGATAVFFVAPTTKGIATVGCVGAVGDASERACRSLASAVVVSGARRLGLTQSAAFLSTLPAVVHKLNSARQEGHGALTTAGSHSAQASAADDLARSYRSAAAVLTPLAAADGEPRAAVDALQSVGSAYAQLAGAARSRDPRAYARAGAAVVGAERLLEDATAKAGAALRRSGTATQSAPAASPTSTSTATREATGTPARTPASTPAAGAREARAQSGGGRGLLLRFGVVLFVVILVGFGLEVRSVIKEEPSGA